MLRKPKLFILLILTGLIINQSYGQNPTVSITGKNVPNAVTSAATFLMIAPDSRSGGRSEERRVGKECRSRWSPYH